MLDEGGRRDLATNRPPQTLAGVADLVTDD
jgi:hypothetical protein